MIFTFDKLTKKNYRTCDGRTVEVTRGPLPIGLTGVKKAVLLTMK